MQRTVLRLAAGTNGSTHTYTSSRNTTLKQLVMAFRGQAFDALNDAASITVELNPKSSSPNTDDTEEFSATIAQIVLSQNFLTSGGGGMYSHLVIPLNEKVSLGDKIRVYAAVAGGGNVTGECVLFMQ